MKKLVKKSVKKINSGKVVLYEGGGGGGGWPCGCSVPSYTFCIPLGKCI